MVDGAVSDAGASLRDTTRKAADMAGILGQRALARGTDYGKSVAKQVEDQPMATMLIAGGIGLLAGLLLARRA